MNRHILIGLAALLASGPASAPADFGLFFAHCAKQTHATTRNDLKELHGPPRDSLQIGKHRTAPSNC